MATAEALCSRALSKLACGTIASFGEGTAEADLAGVLYGPTLEALLSAYNWSFATGQATLARLAAAPLADWHYAYQLPVDFLRVISAGQAGQGRGVSYRIHEGRLHTDADQVILTYVFRPDVSALPPYFAEALVDRLAAEFALPLTESASRAELMANKAELSFRRARAADSQGQTPVAIEDFALINCR